MAQQNNTDEPRTKSAKELKSEDPAYPMDAERRAEPPDADDPPVNVTEPKENPNR